jgi:uncharacterized protein YbaP (TraB family)
MTFRSHFNISLYLILFLISVNGNASSSVWKISSGNQHLYLGGTVHLLAADDYPLPKQFDYAYQRSSTLILEADTSKMQQPNVQQAMMQEAMYPNGESIRSKLSATTYQALKAHCLSRDLDIQHLEKFKPGLLSVILTMTELNNLNITSLGVDDHFSEKANAHARSMGYLESLEEQLSLIANMGKGQEDAFIKYTLEETAGLESMFNDLKNTWRSGDMDKLTDIAIKPFKQGFPILYQALLVKRNNNWLPQIQHMLKTKEVEFILVGALHMAGEDGLIHQLKLAGYQIEKLP